MRFATEVLPGIVAALIVIALTISLIKTHRRAMKAQERADYAESQMELVMKFRGVTHEMLEQLNRAIDLDP